MNPTSSQRRREPVRPGQQFVRGAYAAGAAVLIATGLWHWLRRPERPALTEPLHRAAVLGVVDVRVTRRALNTAESAAYVGDRACARCHATIYRQQSTSRHAHTLRPSSLQMDGPYFRNSNSVTDRLRQYVYRAAVQDGKCVVEVRGPVEHDRLPATLVIGTGRDGRTYLGEIGPDSWVDLRISYYTKARIWDWTPMQQPFVSAWQNPVGIRYSGRAINACILCHSTVLRASPTPVDPDRLDLAHSHIGIGCERCHGPGRAHTERGAKMDDLSTAPPERILQLCGVCHESASEAHAGAPSTEGQIARLEGAALVRSRCYMASKALSCVTCHDPHLDSNPDPESYTPACLSCHSGVSGHKVGPTTKADAKENADAPMLLPVKPGKGDEGKVCPVNPRSGCTTCHMPEQEMDQVPHTFYHNHWIKVWGKAEK